MEATLVASTAGRRGDDVHRAAESGDVPALRHILRAAPERVHEKDGYGRLASKNWLFFCFAGVGGFGGVRCQKKSKILKFGAINELLDFCCICCILGLETRLLLITNEFAAAIRRKLTHRAPGETRNKMDFFLEHHATQNMKRDHSTMDSTRKM